MYYTILVYCTIIEGSRNAWTLRLGDNQKNKGWNVWIKSCLKKRDIEKCISVESNTIGTWLLIFFIL